MGRHVTTEHASSFSGTAITGGDRTNKVKTLADELEGVVSVRLLNVTDETSTEDVYRWNEQIAD